jgi:hypothetical protein
MLPSFLVLCAHHAHTSRAPPCLPFAPVPVLVPHHTYFTTVPSTTTHTTHTPRTHNSRSLVTSAAKSKLESAEAREEWSDLLFSIYGAREEFTISAKCCPLLCSILDTMTAAQLKVRANKTETPPSAKSTVACTGCYGDSSAHRGLLHTTVHYGSWWLHSSFSYFSFSSPHSYTHSYSLINPLPFLIPYDNTIPNKQTKQSQTSASPPSGRWRVVRQITFARRGRESATGHSKRCVYVNV